MYLFISKKIKIQEEIEFVDKFKTVVKGMNSDDVKLNKILEFDNEKMALLLKSLITGNFELPNRSNSNKIFFLFFFKIDFF